MKLNTYFTERNHCYIDKSKIQLKELEGVCCVTGRELAHTFGGPGFESRSRFNSFVH